VIRPSFHGTDALPLLFTGAVLAVTLHSASCWHLRSCIVSLRKHVDTSLLPPW